VDERAFDERYRHWAQRSGELFTEASRYIPGGAGSSAHTVKFGWKPYPPFMAEGPRSRLCNVDGHEYVDYLLGLGPMILGHRHPAVTRAVTRAVRELGTCFGLPYESGPGVPAELEAALLVDVLVPVPVHTPGCGAVGLQLAELVQVPGQVPHVPGLRAVLSQHCFLRCGRVHPVSDHRRLVTCPGPWSRQGSTPGPAPIGPVPKILAYNCREPAATRRGMYV
jgi:hypothetical protein